MQILKLLSVLAISMSALGLFPSSVLAANESQRSAENSAANECVVLQWDKKGYNKPYLPIRSPGKYCIDQDYQFDCYPWSHGCGGNFIDIRSNDVDVDFRGHTVSVSGTRAYTAVWGFGKNIRIHNGTIKGLGVGISLRHRDGGAKSPVYAYPANPVETSPTFGITSFYVEDMIFNDVQRPILLSGSGNIIRHNNITVALKNPGGDDSKSSEEEESRVALLNYGPKALIENNKIIQQMDGMRLPTYSIYVRHSNNSVIKNNQIRIDGSEHAVAIGLSASRGVVIEQNKIFGAQTSVERTSESSASESTGEAN